MKGWCRCLGDAVVSEDTVGSENNDRYQTLKC